MHAAADGAAGLAALHGMFALCVAGEDGSFVAARDRLGIKPLYWARRDGLVAFASELQAYEPDWRPLVEEFPPGHMWAPQGGLTRYGEVAEQTREYPTRTQAQQSIREGLKLAVRRRMMADVGVGVFLSGGLDSSLVAAIMAQESEPGRLVHSFAAGTQGSSDVAAARLVAEHLGLEHHERIYSADDVVAVLPTVVTSIESFEPSLVRSAVPDYLLAELAAQHVKVVLTGEGADELFAGYDHLRDVTDADELRLELIRSVEGLHNLNLQRCDRGEHGARTRGAGAVPRPRPDRGGPARPDRLEAARRGGPGEGDPARGVHRVAAGGDPLAAQGAVRRRQRHCRGDGRRAHDVAADDDWESARVPGLPPARSREEQGYQRMFAARLEGVAAERVLGRFATA